MIYKECNEICRICSKYANYCESCDENFVLINNNCYLKCGFYYYFNENNIYFCTNNFSCPENYNKLIINKSECIDNCMRDNYYKYNFNDTCIEKCPDGTIYNDPNKICHYNEININIDSTYIIDDININRTTNNISINNYINISNYISNNIIYSEEDSLIINLQENIMNGKMNDIIKSVSESKKDFILEDNNVIYQITTSNNQKIKTNNSISTLDLLGCEDILKQKYNINQNLSLIILKIDYVTGHIISQYGQSVKHDTFTTK